MRYVLPTPVLLAVVGALFILHKRRMKSRRKWSKRWFIERKRYSNAKLLEELKVHEPGDYRNYLRMNEECFEYILNKIRYRIEKVNTIMRESVTAEERLAATLRYLATGNSYEDLKFSTAISPQLLSKIIPETCTAIYEELSKEGYLKFPKSEEEWKSIANEFQEKWNFDTCCGAIDGKHINIVKPPNTGSYYYNYKGKFSIVLLAVVNANYEFIMVHAGINGRISDGGVLQETTFYEKLMNDKLHLPRPKTPRGTQFSLPYTFVGDEAFPLLENLMKPYAQKNLTKEERIFNYRLSRARRIVENAFGIMASRFRIFHTDIAIDIEKVDTLVLACCALHNFLRRKSSTTYSPRSSYDQEDAETGKVIPGEWRQDGNPLTPLKRTPRAATARAKKIRDEYKICFNTNGAVPFQEKKCGLTRTDYNKEQ